MTDELELEFMRERWRSAGLDDEQIARLETACRDIAAAFATDLAAAAAAVDFALRLGRARLARLRHDDHGGDA